MQFSTSLYLVSQEKLSVLITSSRVSRSRRREVGQEMWVLSWVLRAPLNPFILESWGCWSISPANLVAGNHKVLLSRFRMSEVPDQRCQQGWALLEARGRLCGHLSALPASTVFLGLGTHGCISVSVDTWLSWLVSVPLVLFTLYKIFLGCGSFSKSLLQLLQYCFCCFCSGFLAVRHKGSSLPDQGGNPYSPHWKAKS